MKESNRVYIYGPTASLHDVTVALLPSNWAARQPSRAISPAGQDSSILRDGPTLQYQLKRIIWRLDDNNNSSHVLFGRQRLRRSLSNLGWRAAATAQAVYTTSSDHFEKFLYRNPSFLVSLCLAGNGRLGLIVDGRCVLTKDRSVISQRRASGRSKGRLPY